MTPTGDIDYGLLRKLLQFHVQEGTDNLCILGTTGEASVMSMAEREKVLKVAVEEVKGKMPILAGTGTINPAHVKEMTQQAIDLGCDANLVVCPYYVKPPQRGLIQHFITMADMGLPVVIYNIPGRTAVDMKNENIAICAEHENVIGVKDATGDLSRIQSLRDLVGKDFLMYSGDDSTSMEFVNLGGDGCISVTANVAPKAIHDVMMAALEGRTEDADRINKPLEPLHKKLFVESNPIPAKWAVKKLGLIDSAFCRPPLAEMDPAFESDVTDALRAAGLL
jgi:4-hydroxy-tetrahydrodipicolinate synthase